MSAKDREKKIDIEKVFRVKNPRLYPFIPSFVFRYLKRIIHQTELNEFLRQNADKKNVEFASSVLSFLRSEIVTIGLEHVPLSGSCIIVSNHPVGSLDGMALIREVARRRKDIKFLVNDILMNVENMEGVFVPVNKHGKNTQQTIREMEALYASGQVLMIFPAGLVSRKLNGRIQDLEWKKSFIKKAKQHHQLIIPVFISGRNSNFFYCLGNLRTFLGIKANIEMLYLVDETFKQQDKTITLIFGEPIQPSQLTESLSDVVWAEKIRGHVYRMGASGQPLPFSELE
ncbi:MAG: 1-acyl-sn-glycerol-3-phosphate acyltransferase [Bacteroidia bacterium]